MLAAGVVFPGGAPAQLGGGPCVSANPPAIDAPAQRLRFGITPLSAGTAGASQAQPKPDDPAAALAELRRLRPGRRQLILRLNRMSMADGEAGIHRYASLVDDYAKAGFDTELQVRYHPGPGQDGDMAAWTRYVRDAVSVLGKRPSVKALTITNEGNFPVSPNTSDGPFSGVKQAIVSGTIAARQQLDRMGRPDVRLGFSFAWRWLPSSDAAFWQDLGSLGNARFRQAVDYVGLQIYPGLVYPPVLAPGRSAGDEIVEALTLLRGCYMPMAGLGRRVALWVTENGYATNLGRSEAEQVGSLSSTLDEIHRYSGTLGVTDYRWFNLRDNDSSGTDLFDAVGVLRDDYAEKPAFATLRSAIQSIGTDQTPPAAMRRPRGHGAGHRPRGPAPRQPRPRRDLGRGWPRPRQGQSRPRPDLHGQRRRPDPGRRRGRPDLGRHGPRSLPGRPRPRPPARLRALTDADPAKRAQSDWVIKREPRQP